MAMNIDRQTLVEFGPYRLTGVRSTDNELGRGSYAVVLELEYRGLKCAGKKLYSILYEHAARRYLEECRLLSQARHPNIVQFLGVYFEEGSQFPILVMELLPTNLTSCLERYGVLPDEVSYTILNDVALGLCYLHSQTPSIIHRDLSANNVLVSSNMTAKISDLGVARILNLTPVQMTETPGTQAYMPPEVMIANPQYNTSLDVFSYGVMMVHVFTAEWPAPKVGQNRVDPSDPHQLIPVSEAERREEFLQKIGQDHPLMDLIMSCLKNNPQLRVPATEIVGRMNDLVLRFPPSFQNRIDMLQRISADEAERGQLQQEIDTKVAQIDDKEREITSIMQTNERQKQEQETTAERINLAHSTEVEQLQIQVADKEATIQLRESEIVNKTAALSFCTSELDSCRANQEKVIMEVEQLQQQVAGQKAMISVQESELAANTSRTAALESENAIKLNEQSTNIGDLNASKAALEKKEAINTSLSDQLTRTRQYLSSKPQPLQVNISYSQCTDSPKAMSFGQSVVINGKVYYGGGFCDKDGDEYNIHCYNPLQDKWMALPPNNVRYFGLGQINRELVTVGGVGPIEGTNRFKHSKNIYNLKEHSQAWKKSIPPMPTARFVPTVLSHPSCLVVAGGAKYPGNSTLDTVEIYNINTSQWSQTNKLPIACFLLSGVVSKDMVYLVGGRDDEQRQNRTLTASINELLSNAIPVTQPNEEQRANASQECDSAWNEVANTPDYWPSAVAVSDMVLAMGGVRSYDLSTYQPVKGIYAYSTSMNSWVQIGDLPAPVAGMAIAALPPTEFIVIGSLKEVEAHSKTVYKGNLNITIT